MGSIGDAGIGAGKCSEKGDASNDHHEVFCLQREEHIHVKHTIRKREAVGEQHAINSSRSADGRREVVRRNQKYTKTGSDTSHAVVLKETPTTPVSFQLASKHEQRKHVEQQMKEPTPVVKEHVSEKLPEIEITNHQRRNEAEVTGNRIPNHQLHNIDRHTG